MVTTRLFICLIACLAAAPAVYAQQGVGVSSVPAQARISSSATLEIISGDSELNLELPAPGSISSEPIKSNTVSFLLKTDSDVNLEIHETLSDAFLSILSEDEIKDIIAPTVVVSGPLAETRQEAASHGRGHDSHRGRQLKFHGLRRGRSYPFDLHLEARWSAEDDWWKLLADTYRGEVVITVSEE